MQPKLQKITFDGKIIAIVVKEAFGENGVTFVSKEEFPLQLGISCYREGEKIRPHLHPDRKVTISKIQEVVHFVSGRAIVNLYNLNGEKIKSVELSTGDTIFFVEGGHGFMMLEDTKLMEVKQGPYFGKDTDKLMLE